MEYTAGDALLNNPTTARVRCKQCGALIIGAREALEHLDVHE